MTAKNSHVELSVEAARAILQEARYPRDRAEKVVRIISEHSTEKPADAPTSLEAKIPFDADKLDGLGATGICRVFALFGQQGKMPLEAVPWHLHKMEIAREKMQDRGRDEKGCERGKICP